MTDLTPRWTLAIDTSTYTQILAIMRDDEVVTHSQALLPSDHGAALLSSIHSLLHTHHLRPQDLHLIVVGLGPGSFTGLRVGISCAKAIARAAHVPIVGISTLATLAYPTARRMPGAVVCATVDARKREVYAGFYSYQHTSQTLITTLDEATYTPQALRDTIIARAPQAVVSQLVQKYKPLRDLETLGAVHISEPLASIEGSALAILGRQHFNTHGPHPLHTLEPHYIRPSDAEINTPLHTP